MSEWTIYSKSGAAKAVVHELELHDEWMGECFLTVSVKSAEPIDFAVGDYIDYRDERYVIEYDPTVLKKARSGSYGEGFTYDNIKFVNKAQAEIVRCDFTDIVLGDNKQHYTSLPTFPFYCETVDDLLDRIQANLQELYGNACQFILIGLNRARASERGRLVGRQQAFEAAFDQYVGSSTSDYGKKGVALTVDNITCWDALTKVHLDFGLNFIQRGYVVVVGTAGFFTANTFTYGKGNGLYEVEKIGDSEQQIVTRLRAYGSETNLPINYYANLHKEMYTTGVKDTISPDGSYTAYGIKTRTLYSAIHPATNDDINITLEYNNRTVKANCDGYTEDGVKYVWWYFSEADHALSKAFYDALPEGNVNVYAISGVKKEKWPSNLVEVSGDYPANLVMNRLMLPGFPDTDLRSWVSQNRPSLLAEGFEFSQDKTRPYIDSPNVSEYGIRPGSIYFDGSNDTDDIHPTITGSGYDEIISATQITDTGVYDTTEPDPITIVIPGMNGFALDEAWKQGASIDITDGMCGGRSFEITKTPKKVDGNWQCTCKRSYDDTLHLWFPYSDFQINANNRHDKFVLTGIDLPDAYVTLASERLFDAAIAALRKNDAPRFTFQPRIDEIWMQRQDDMAHANHITSIHDTLKAGDIFRFADADVLGVDGNDQPVVNSIIIDVLTIKENGNNGIPTYEVTLRDEKQISTIQKIANKVDSLANGGNGSGSGGGSGVTAAQMESLIPSAGAYYFLSKNDNDTAKGIITFLKGIKIGLQKLFGWDAEGNITANDVNVSGLLTSMRAKIDEMRSSNNSGSGLFESGWFVTNNHNGHSYLEIDELLVRMKAVFMELEIRKETYSGGNVFYSPAGSVIYKVECYKYDTEHPGEIIRLDAETKEIVRPFTAGGRMLALLSEKTGLFSHRDVVTIQKEVDHTEVDFYRCYLIADDGTVQTRNWWRKYDQARCQTFNRAYEKSETGTSDQIDPQFDDNYVQRNMDGNRFFWRLVTNTGTTRLDDGKWYDYVDLSNRNHDEDTSGTYNYLEANGYVPGSDFPVVGDSIVCIGNRMDAERMNMIMLEVIGSDAPAIKIYRGINTFSLEGRKYMSVSPKKIQIRVGSIEYITDYGTPVPTKVWRDYWEPGIRYHYYDEVSHAGSTWLCMITDGYHWEHANGEDAPTPAQNLIIEGEGLFAYGQSGGKELQDRYYATAVVSGETIYKVRNYTTVEPSNASATIWHKEVSAGGAGTRGAFKSRVFARTNTDISSAQYAPTGGDYDHPWPGGADGTTQQGVTWYDGIPNGSEMLWSSVCTFSDGVTPVWSRPAQETDNRTQDVEFSLSETRPDAPSGNVPYTDHSQDSNPWYDPSRNPTLPTGKTWNDMVWRAERKVNNGVYSGDWVITKILGEDGDPTPSYVEIQEAWSNIATVATQSTEPVPNGGWSNSTPSNPNNYAYLWRRSRTRVWDAATESYTTPNWTYVRLNGTNGTSIEIKDNLAVLVTSGSSFPTSGMTSGDLGVKQGDAKVYRYNGSNWSAVAYTASDGDSFVVSKDCMIDLDGDGVSENVKGHLVMWSAEATKWIDLGRFQGEDGVAYYTHIAWADSVTIGTPPSTRTTGQTSIPNASAVGNFSVSPVEGYDWMGVLVDQNAADPTSTYKLCYTWKYTKGSAGPAGGNTATVYLYKRSDSAVTTVGIGATLFYKFSTKKLYTTDACTTDATTQLNGWSLIIPSGTDPIYVTAAIAYSETDVDDIGSNEWVTPAQFTENGENGINSATVFLYKRAAAIPDDTNSNYKCPQQTLYYKFADGKLYKNAAMTQVATKNDGLNGWEMEIPATDGNACYVIQAVALSTNELDAIEVTKSGSTYTKNDWSGVRKLVEDGVTPTVGIDPNSKNWIINGVDTGIKAEGENGKGIAMKGVRDVLWNSEKTGNKTSLEEISSTAQYGDCYSVLSTNHLYFRDNTSTISGIPSGWLDMGEYKGEPGDSSYVHIAYATSITLSNGIVTAVTGFTVDNSGTDYDWWGFCTDHNETDPGRGASSTDVTAARNYKWNYMKGKDGNGVEYIYLLTKEDFKPTINQSSGQGTPSQGEFLPAVANYTAGKIYGNSQYWEDDPPASVSDEWPVLWWASRKYIYNTSTGTGSWSAFDTPTLHNRWSKDGPSSPFLSEHNVYYARNNSGTTAPTSGWGTAILEPTSSLRYVWKKEVWIYDAAERGRNRIKNSDFTNNGDNWRTFGNSTLTYTTVSEKKWCILNTSSSTAWSGFVQNVQMSQPVKTGHYRLSADIYYNSANVCEMWFGLKIYNSSSTKVGADRNILIMPTATPTRYTVDIEVTESDASAIGTSGTWVLAPQLMSTANGYTETLVYSTNWKLEYGDTPTDWCKAPEDLYKEEVSISSIYNEGVRGDFKSTVFKRTNTTPVATPTGGSYDTPWPGGVEGTDGWYDGIPNGEAILWASTRTFYGDGRNSVWSTPKQMTDTADFDVEFSSVESPNPPSGHPNTNTQWSNTSGASTIWMATSEKHNGVWSAWQVSKIKGENGENAVRIDLDNEMDAVSVDSSGTTVRFDRTVTTVARIYDGATKVQNGISHSMTSASLSFGNYSTTVSSPSSSGDVTITWTFKKGDTINASTPKTVTLRYNGVDYTAKFTLKAMEYSAIYQCAPSPSALSFDWDVTNQQYTPRNVTLYYGYTKDEGNGQVYVAQPSEYTIDNKYYIARRTFRIPSGQSTYSWSSWAFKASDLVNKDDSFTATSIEMCITTASNVANISDANIIDREVIPIVREGKSIDPDDPTVIAIIDEAVRDAASALKDGLTIVMKPQVLIYNQDDKNAATFSTSSTGQRTTVEIYRGDNTANFTIVQDTVMAYGVASGGSVAEMRGCTGYDNTAKTVWLSNVTQLPDSTTGNYKYAYDHGYIEFTVTVDPGTSTAKSYVLQVSWYLNRLGNRDTITRGDMATTYMSRTEYTLSEVGGTNIMRGTRDLKSGAGTWASGTVRKSGTGTFSTVEDSTRPVKQTKSVLLITADSGASMGVAQDGVELTAGKITMSCWVKGNSGTTGLIQAFWSNSHASGVKEFTCDGTWQKIVHTATANTASYNIGYVYVKTANASIRVCGFKVERGEKATDWSPAPEDEQSDLAVMKTDYEGKIESSASGLTQDYTQKISDATSGLVTEENFASYKQTATQNFAQLQNTVNGHTKSISTIQQTANAISMNVYEGSAILYNRSTQLTVSGDGTNVNIYNSSYDKISSVSNRIPSGKYYIRFSAEVNFDSRATSGYLSLTFYLRDVSGTAVNSEIVVYPEDIGTGKWVPVEIAGEYTSKIDSFDSNGIDAYNDTGYSCKVRKVVAEIVSGDNAKMIGAGINITSGRIDMLADNFTLTNNSGEQTMGVDENGDVDVMGTIRSKNFYHDTCLYVNGGTYSTKWYYCKSRNDDRTIAGGYVVGKYYNKSGLDGNSDFVQCTYNADVVICVLKYNESWSGNYGPCLPKPEDFKGKIVEINPIAYGTSRQTVKVDCVVTNKFATTVIYDSTDGVKVTGNPSVEAFKAVSAGYLTRLLSIEAKYNGVKGWYWLILNSNG